MIRASGKNCFSQFLYEFTLLSELTKLLKLSRVKYGLQLVKKKIEEN